MPRSQSKSYVQFWFCWSSKKTESITHVVRVDVRTELEPDRLLGNLILFSYVSDALSRNELLFSEIYLWTHQKVVGRARQQTESANVLCEFLLSSTFIAQLEPSARWRWWCWAFPYMNITQTRTFLLKMRVHCVWRSRCDENLQNHSLALLAFDSITACQSKSFASSLITNSLRLDSETAVRIYRLVWVRKNKFDLTLSYVGLFRLWKRNQQTSKSTSWFRLDFNSFIRCLGRVTTLIDSWCDDSEWATFEFFFYGHFTSVN